MPATLARLGGVLLLALLTWAAVAAARRFVERNRRRVLSAAVPLPEAIGSAAEGAAVGDAAVEEDAAAESGRAVRILAFGSEECAQCHRLQAPALRRVEAARGSAVAVVEIDAPSAPELTSRYRVLTLPTTVVLDGAGRARAINYGFANSERLLEQVDALLDPDAGAMAERTA